MSQRLQAHAADADAPSYLIDVVGKLGSSALSMVSWHLVEPRPFQGCIAGFSKLKAPPL